VDVAAPQGFDILQGFGRVADVVAQIAVVPRSGMERLGGTLQRLQRIQHRLPQVRRCRIDGGMHLAVRQVQPGDGVRVVLVDHIDPLTDLVVGGAAVLVFEMDPLGDLGLLRQRGQRFPQVFHAALTDLVREAVQREDPL
jgi:hypothetical protein